MQLFTFCPMCKNSTVPRVKRMLGTFISIIQKFTSCKVYRIWDSQPFINNIPEGNLHLSTAILVTGASVLRLLECLECAVYSKRTFFLHQRKYLFPAISTIWENQQHEVVEEVLSNGVPITIGRDTRCDSPGHSAKCASYPLLNLHTNVSSEVIQLYSN